MGLIDRLRDMYETVRAGTVHGQNMTLLSWWITRGTIAKLVDR